MHGFTCKKVWCTEKMHDALRNVGSQLAARASLRRELTSMPIFFTLKQRLYAIFAIDGRDMALASILVVHGHPDRADW
jgi:hypothetical protein